MKKIGKINIIEEGRICSPEELDKIRGGDSCGSATYKSCSNGVYITCSESSMVGYYTDGDSTTCSIGYTYEHCAIAYPKTSCSGDHYYEIFSLG